ncbi:MAG: apolipoprotein A1/A4/E family protein [Methylovulum sp.]|jgi:predicted  nucleic acid-binding Zn-ribbon protein|nr:apolipoprotein A1/A4/E family protein [Methylovulum sp.]
MFENNVFDDWLDTKAKAIIVAMGEGKALLPEEMMVLVLKAQTNHFNHLDIDLRQDMQDLRIDLTQDMKNLRTDLTQDMQNLRTDLTQDMQRLRTDLTQDMKNLRIDMDKRFEQVDKRFEQVDKRFEQVDKRFEQVISRMDSFMIWSFATTLTAAGIVIASIKFL